MRYSPLYRACHVLSTTSPGTARKVPLPEKRYKKRCAFIQNSALDNPGFIAQMQDCGTRTILSLSRQNPRELL